MSRPNLATALADAAPELNDAQLAELIDMVDQAQARQRQQLGQTLEDSLNFVPRLLRGQLRKILFK